MQPVDWDNIRHFLAVVEAGSVRQAALRLGVNQTTVSRRISALEARLGQTLFDRAANNWAITPVGERLLASAEQMAEEATAIERHAMAESRELRGRLRLTVGDVCTQQLVMPVVQAFIRQYPDIDLEVIATREDLDLAALEADVALRATDTPPQNLVGKRIARMGYAIYGNRQLLERVQENPDDASIACITWLGDSHTRPPWIEKSFPATQRVYRTSELGVMRQMAGQGLGLAQLPCALGDPDPALQRVPAHFVEPGWGLWVLSHVDLRTTARVRIFKDFLVGELEKKKDLIEGRIVQAARDHF